MVLKYLGLALALPFLHGFVLLSGPAEAKLPVSRESPVLTFRLEAEPPKIGGKDEFLDGQYENLPNDQFFLTLVQEVLRQWNSVEGAYIQLDVITDENAKIETSDKAHSIAKGSLPATAAASAHPTIEGKTIEDCDILISDRTTDATSLAYTMLHEVGHCLGLGHNHTNYNAVMGYARTNTELYLSADDRAGVIYLYPAEDIKKKELVSCSVVGASNSFAESLSLLLLLPLLAPLFFRQRRR